MGRALRIAVVVCALWFGLSGCGGGGSGNNSPSTPFAPTGATPDTWVGTLSRPAGLAPIAVQWVVTQTNQDISGTVTLMNGSTSVSFPLGATLSGSNTDGYNLFWNLNGRPANLPNCSIIGNGPAAKGLKAPITTLTSDAFTVNYNNCQGFVEPDPLSNFHSESTQFALKKQ